MWWMLLKLMGLRYAAIAKRYAGFEWMLKMLVDGVKGQTCSTQARFLQECGASGM